MIDVDRRSVLRGACLGCAGLALAACGGGGGKSVAAEPPAASGASPSAAGGAAAPKPLAVLAEMKIGESVAAKTSDGRNLLLTRTSQGSVVAFSAICTHQGCTVEPDGAKLACPCHGSMYDAATGKVIGGPAPAPLHPVDVTVQNGDVVLA